VSPDDTNPRRTTDPALPRGGVSPDDPNPRPSPDRLLRPPTPSRDPRLARLRRSTSRPRCEE
jgi:hypothetical protein